VIQVSGFSFPSGHAMVSAAFYLFLAYLAWRYLRGPARAICIGALILLVGLIGLTRMYLGVHYLTDVVAGYLAGFFWTDGVVLAERWLEARRSAVSDQRSAISPPHAPERGGD
jgi:undecaprenyl-diphosphatase